MVVINSAVTEHSVTHTEKDFYEDTLRISMLCGESWWGACATDGVKMPFTSSSKYSFNLGNPPLDNLGLGIPSNQSSPLLISSCGRYIYSEKPFSLNIENGTISIKGEGIYFGKNGDSLKDAYQSLIGNYFIPSGKLPATELFSKIQYNTWIEMPYEPTQEKVINYVNRLVKTGMPPGVLMIDDNWATDYGTLDFDQFRFPNPKQMCKQLHELGFNIMLWIVPFISPDSSVARELWQKGLLLKNKKGKPAIRQWWNGYSATLDLSNPNAHSWITDKLHKLQEYGIDGFKFDAGDIRDYRQDDLTAEKILPAEQCEQWAKLATQFPFNEMRACWKNNGQPLAQRLEDKPPTWDKAGIEALIPNLLAQGLMGYAYVCPDMIGGGEINAMQKIGNESGIDQEFFVRYTQVATLCPMMQFSSSPARILDQYHYGLVQKAIKIRETYLPLIMRLAKESAQTGEPIMRHMAYHCPGLENIKDQFFIGPDLIVAPVVKKGVKTRQVVLPRGKWQADDGLIVNIEDSQYKSITVATPLERLPIFQRI